MLLERQVEQMRLEAQASINRNHVPWIGGIHYTNELRLQLTEEVGRIVEEIDKNMRNAHQFETKAREASLDVSQLGNWEKTNAVLAVIREFREIRVQNFQKLIALGALSNLRSLVRDQESILKEGKRPKLDAMRVAHVLAHYPPYLSDLILDLFDLPGPFDSSL